MYNNTNMNNSIIRLLQQANNNSNYNFMNAKTLDTVSATTWLDRYSPLFSK